MEEKHVGSQTWQQGRHAFWLLFRQFILGAKLRWFVRVFVWFSLNWTIFDPLAVEVSYHLISLHMLAYVKAYGPEQTVFWETADSTYEKKYSLLCCAVRGITLIAAILLPVMKKQATIHPGASYSLTTVPHQGLLKQQCVSYQLLNCITHTHAPVSARVLGCVPLPKATGRLCLCVCVCLWYERVHVWHKHSIWKLWIHP